MQELVLLVTESALLGCDFAIFKQGCDTERLKPPLKESFVVDMGMLLCKQYEANFSNMLNDSTEHVHNYATLMALLLNSDSFHRLSTDLKCQQRTLSPPDIWFRSI